MKMQRQNNTQSNQHCVRVVRAPQRPAAAMRTFALILASQRALPGAPQAARREATRCSGVIGFAYLLWASTTTSCVSSFVLQTHTR